MQKAYTVAQINQYIKNMFTQDYLLNSVSVKGEVSNCKYHSSGHIYFTLKDKQSVLACIMFAGNRAKGLSFPLQEGMQVCVTGKVDIYERDGKYQMYAVRIEQDGLGELFERYEKLKKDLESKGYFEKEHKKPIPQYVKRLGVVTASTGAAVRDIISISKSRNPYIEILLYPAIVQGVDAAPSIVRGIQMLDAVGVDAVIVGRGGGSIEDLWAFNEEMVAMAIYECETPVISAVGHETDTTIADFVADVRAETPSAAAQIAVCNVELLTGNIEMCRDRLYRSISGKIERERNRVGLIRSNIEKKSPLNIIREKRFFTMKNEEMLKQHMLSIIKERRYRLGIAAGKLDGASPLAKLNQGYAYVADKNGNNIKSIRQVKEGSGMDIYLADGRVGAVVSETEELKGYGK